MRFFISYEHAKTAVNVPLPSDYVVAQSLITVPFCIAGTIRTSRVLDRETKAYYWLTVYAHDRGTVPRSSFTEVYVAVQDVNDNVPQTPQPAYYPSILENSSQGTTVLKLQAEDRDQGRGSQLTYTITSGNPQGFFDIDALTGQYNSSTFSPKDT